MLLGKFYVVVNSHKMKKKLSSGHTGNKCQLHNFFSEITYLMDQRAFVFDTRQVEGIA